jgi:hypothetical protein
MRVMEALSLPHIIDREARFDWRAGEWQALRQ